ncbi:hypothetical protein BDZ97DRAFT_1772425, partial [Flammula alnicola]
IDVHNEITLINCSFVKEEDIMDLAQMTVCRLIHGGQDDFCSKSKMDPGVDRTDELQFLQTLMDVATTRDIGGD